MHEDEYIFYIRTCFVGSFSGKIFFKTYNPLWQHMVKIKVLPRKSNLKTFMLSFIFRKTC